MLVKYKLFKEHARRNNKEDTISSSPLLHLHRKFIEQIHIRKSGVKIYTRLKSWAQLNTPIFSSGEYVMAQLFEALRYMPEGRGFDSRCHWNFSFM